MALWRDDVLAAVKSIGGSGTLAEIYDAVSKIREDLPTSWQAIVRREVEESSPDSESYKGKYNYYFSVEGIGSGVWGLIDNLPKTPNAIDIDVPPGRTESTTFRIIRDTKLTRKLKALHHQRCQICGDRVELANDEFYSEAHHIVPLGGGHEGLDKSDNILILCPSHHVQCDYGAIQIDRSKLRKIAGHRINPDFIGYHNSKLFKR
jgi:hypothetical protein